MNTTRLQATQTAAAALGLALSITVATLMGLNHLASNQAANQLLARASAVQQAQASAAGALGTARI